MQLFYGRHVVMQVRDDSIHALEVAEKRSLGVSLGFISNVTRAILPTASS